MGIYNLVVFKDSAKIDENVSLLVYMWSKRGREYEPNHTGHCYKYSTIKI
jgi:hypothetical protein